jgi:release factor glutamine methyltransferase
MMARSIADLISDATGRLSAVTPTPALDAELLLCAACGLTRTELAARHALELTAQQSSHLSDLIDRRTVGEPVAYLLGHKEFWSLDLAVNPSTLIPRPETEQLVEQVLTLIPPDTPCRVADLGTGSGAVALAIASERPQVHVTATDISQIALQVASANALKFGIHNVAFLCADWFEPVVESGFRVIVSNPPYVRSHDPLLEASTRYEPREAATHLEPAGALILEHSHDQGPALQALLSAAGFSSIVTRADGAGLPRVTLGRLVRKA